MTPAAPLPGAVLPAAAGFLRDVLRGLRRRPKRLPSKYFYDAEGSRLFEEICELEEYYLTRCELDLLRRHAGEMAELAGPRAVLIEYGSGSGLKTRLLLDRLRDLAAYVPVDISGEHLRRSAERLARRYPRLAVLPVAADFTRPFDLPPLPPGAGRRTVFFSGSTIGNFRPAEAVRLLARMARVCGPGGGLLIAADRKKDRAVLEAAYNDRRGVTAAFNLNLLARINRELGADFALDRFRHRAFYDAARGRIEMHLVSLADQTAHVGGWAVAFARGETVRTEYSYKYDPQDFEALAARAGLRVRQEWADEKGWFGVWRLTPQAGGRDVGGCEDGGAG